MKVSELLGMPIVSMNDGEKVGEVKDLLIEPERLQTVALVLGGKPGQGLLPFDQVKNVGSDAVTIESAQLIQWATGQLATDTGRKASELRGLTVIDGTGNDLGTLQDIQVDVIAGKVSSLHISRGGVFGLGAQTVDVPAASIRSIGPSLITVDAPPSEPA